MENIGMMRGNQWWFTMNISLFRVNSDKYPIENCFWMHFKFSIFYSSFLIFSKNRCLLRICWWSNGCHTPLHKLPWIITFLDFFKKCVALKSAKETNSSHVLAAFSFPSLVVLLECGPFKNMFVHLNYVLKVTVRFTFESVLPFCTENGIGISHSHYERNLDKMHLNSIILIQFE